jgi:hypothetical protein
MEMRLDILKPGSSEGLKAGVHATALGLAVVMGVYNAAAFVRRRQPHLAVNAVLYAALTLWEQKHVAHHLAALRASRPLDDLAEIDEPQKPRRSKDVAA